jgi:sucrose-6-phosphate hydrolase SacC (GH32 family)
MNDTAMINWIHHRSAPERPSRRRMLSAWLFTALSASTIVVDRNSVEVFAADGRTVVTDLILPALTDDRVSVFAEGGDATFSDIAVTRTAL